MRDWVRRVTGAREVEVVERVQSLWSGYGEIVRVRLDGGETVICKRVAPPRQARHPRGWSTSRSHDRKLRSYAIESRWYRDHAARCTDACRVPRCLAAEELAAGETAAEETQGGFCFLLEDLDAAGFSARRTEVSDAEIDRCLAWLAGFHATFLGAEPEGLWEVGTYWHLATRPDELAVIDDDALRDAAARIDARLNAARFSTFVHGDAKLANFCFRPDSSAVAAVDFQYVGGGCGMKDVAYFLSSCLDAGELEASQDAHLDAYFTHLREALSGREVDVDALEAEWRALYPLAWADFVRFLVGWSPGHWKLHDYSRALTRDVLVRDPSR